MKESKTTLARGNLENPQMVRLDIFLESPCLFSALCSCDSSFPFLLPHLTGFHDWVHPDTPAFSEICIFEVVFTVF